MTDDFLARFEERRQQRADADRTFPLAGETLTVKATAPAEVGLAMVRMRVKVAQELDAARKELSKKNGKPVDPAKLAIITSDEEMIQVADETALELLEPDCHDAWARLRDPKNPAALSFEELFEVVDYLQARVARVPFDAASGSSTGPTETSPPSEEDSSSPATTRAESASPVS